ncbi:hypothetical protein CHS0354_003263 [Potamilus streckersoni]|uniref:SEFIR domain-containing protein n=1 Tax=Potamilus streckersoni TaxID=2493646 RepID=A0AAE0SW04_9BIVA|nr:hypothetical protein CHS0354_003263 [Potamilus streckersoni]
MAAEGARNMGRMQLVPPCPLRYAPYSVLMKLARSIDTVNNNDGHGCMILAELLGCTPDHIRSIMTRADRDFHNSFSPTMILFNDLQNQNYPVVTLRDIEKVLLELKLEAVTVLYRAENCQKIQWAYSDSIGINNNIDINAERCVCNCFNCLHDSSDIMQHNQSFNTPSGISHPNVSQRQQGLFEVSRADNPRSMLANAPETIKGDYVGSNVCWERPLQPHSGYSFTINESRHFEHRSESERICAARGTLPPLFIAPDRAGVERGPSTAPPCIQSHQERNMHLTRFVTRQMSEYHPRFCAGRTIPQDFKNKVTECISPGDNYHVDNEEVYCTCSVMSSKFFHPGNNQGQLQSRCTCDHCSLTHETFVKSSYGSVDYSQCTCDSPGDLQNNHVLNSVQTSNEHSDHLISSDSEHVHFSESRLNRSQSQLDVKKEQREHENMDNKHSSMDETKALFDGSENGSCPCSLITCQTGPSLSVFVTYSRHSLEHVQEVIELCIRLKGNRIRVRVDFSGDKTLDFFQNKHDWLDANLRIARYVIVCISPTYCEDAAPPCNSEPIPDVRRLDVRYIFDRLRTEYHENCSQNMRVIPVIFENSGASRKHLPSFMATTYVFTYPRQVDSITEFIRSFTPPVR